MRAGRFRPEPAGASAEPNSSLSATSASKASSYRDYESCLDKLARHFMDLELADLEPPTGTQKLEEFLDETWGDKAGRTYNKNLSILRDFFKWAVLRGKLHGDPTLAIERARNEGVHRETFTSDDRAAS